MRLALLTIALLYCAIGSAQSFPKDFVGSWKGTLLWYQGNKKLPQRREMQLIIRPADTAGQYTFQLVYGTKEQDNRPYLLKPLDTAAGHWVIDERNGIVLDQYWVGNRLTGAFTVESTTIVNSYRREGKTLVVEFHSITAAAVSKTGGGSPDIPPVQSYGIRGYQKAVLRRQ
jgi:hypothetical protein